MRPARWFAVVGLVAAVAACGGDGGDRAKAFPEVQIADVRGDPLQSSAVLGRDRPTIVAIWGVTCVPCKEELPRLQAFVARQPGVAVAAVNLGDDPDAIASYARGLGLTLPIYIDDEGRLAEELGVVQLPATVFVDARGNIVERHLGPLSAAELDAGGARLLGGAAQTTS